MTCRRVQAHSAEAQLNAQGGRIKHLLRPLSQVGSFLRRFYTEIRRALSSYPAPLRSLLMYLAMIDLFRARWTEATHEKWMRSVQEDYAHITREKAERVRDCLVTR